MDFYTTSKWTEPMAAYWSEIIYEMQVGIMNGLKQHKQI